VEIGCVLLRGGCYFQIFVMAKEEVVAAFNAYKTFELGSSTTKEI